MSTPNPAEHSHSVEQSPVDQNQVSETTNAAPEASSAEQVSPQAPAFTWEELDTKAPIGLHEMIEAGTHFGHQTRRWNPKMRPYIYGARNGIHIIDLDQTAALFAKAFRFIAETVARGGTVLFVGTKSQAAEIIEEEAARAGQFFVTGRWLGGTLTNYRTVRSSIDQLRKLEDQEADGSFVHLTKREALGLTREKEKLNKYLGGIKSMPGIPSVMFVVDPNHEHIAVKECKKLHIPIVALTDTNCDPELVDYVIPGNDDSIRSVRLLTSRIADACLMGAERQRSQGWQENQQTPSGDSSVQVEFSRGRRSSPAVTSL